MCLLCAPLKDCAPLEDCVLHLKTMCFKDCAHPFSLLWLCGSAPNCVCCVLGLTCMYCALGLTRASVLGLTRASVPA